MRLLAIDTALEVCAAAVFDAAQGALLARESLPMARGHAEALMPMIARVMDAAGIEFAGLGRIAVTVGPGSFTGLRVGISAARGIALASGKPAVGLSTLSAFAAPHVSDEEATSIVAAIDARHAHVYLQVFDAGGRTVVNPSRAPIEDALHAALDGRAIIVGTAVNAILAAWPVGQPPPLIAQQERAPDIEWVARLGAAARETGDPPKPLYLQTPDARPYEASRQAPQ
jgi:tRNA threonylcarbamoyl adenosine modification protein YeaZ